MVDTLADLHATDPRKIGLGDYGKPQERSLFPDGLGIAAVARSGATKRGGQEAIAMGVPAQLVNQLIRKSSVARFCSLAFVCKP